MAKISTWERDLHGALIFRLITESFLFKAIFDVPFEWNNYAKVILMFNIQAHRRLVDYVVFHPKIFDRISVVS